MAENIVNSSDELLDLVDENDNVIGTVAKDAANHDPSLLHREAGGLIYDESNRVIIQQRSLSKILYPGVWIDSFSGHVTKGLTPEEAAHKELIEELGFDVPLKFMRKIKMALPNETHFTYYYLGRYLGAPIIVDKKGVAQAGFFTEKEFDELIGSTEGYQNDKMKYTVYSLLKSFWAGEFDRFKNP